MLLGWAFIWGRLPPQSRCSEVFVSLQVTHILSVGVTIHPYKTQTYTKIREKWFTWQNCYINVFVRSWCSQLTTTGTQETLAFRPFGLKAFSDRKLIYFNTNHHSTPKPTQEGLSGREPWRVRSHNSGKTAINWGLLRSLFFFFFF